MSDTSSDDIWSRWERSRVDAATLPLTATPASLPAPESIPPREWLYGTRLIRRFVSVLAAPGGVGKSVLALAQALALVTGRGFLGEHVHHSVPAWVMNLEDPLDELNRRVAALMALHALPREAVAGRLHLTSGRVRRLRMAEFGEAGIVHPDQRAVVDAAVANGIGLIVVDPFVKSHALDENANTHMDVAATAWAEVAEAAGAAVLLVHHVRKASAERPGGDVDSMRGAKSLSDAARAAALLAPMTADEAEQLSVPARQRWRHVRLDDAKLNMAPRADTALWYRLESVSLGNGNALYPHGDSVAAIAAWAPPSPFAGLTPHDCNLALDRIAAGTLDGCQYGAQRVGRAGDRWVGAVLMDGFGLDAGQASRVVAAWLKSGLLEEAEYRHPGQRKLRLGVRVNDAKRPTIPETRQHSETDHDA
jgi:hypothetical protein